MILSNSVFSANHAHSDGGALYHESRQRSSVLNITSCSFIENEGAQIHNDGGILTLRSCHFSSSGDDDDISLVSGTVASDCGAGTDGTDGLSAPASVSDGSTVASCALCDPGTFSAEAPYECAVCAAGGYTELPGSTSCDICPAGSSIADDAVMATFHDDVEDCAVCGAGEYFDGTSLGACLVCPAGTYNNHISGHSNHDDVSDCLPCAAGTFLNDDADLAGNHDDPSDCSACPDGEVSPPGSRSCLLDCPAGSFNDGDDCAICPAGSYTDSTNADSCTVCPEGTYLEDNAATLSAHDNVDDCMACPAGSFLEDDGTDVDAHDSLDDCSVCKAGSYMDATGASACTVCPPGEYFCVASHTDIHIHH